MDPKIWHNLSYIFLSAGIGFFLVTVILSVKFQLFSMIKADLGNRQKKNITGKEEYFAFVENKNKAINNIEAIKATETDSQPPEMAVQPQKTAPPADDDTGSTVLISSRSRSVRESSDTVVTSGRKSAGDDGDFVITDSIIVIHGNPFITERNP